MNVIVYTKRGDELAKFFNISEIREYNNYYEVVPEDDAPRPQIFNKKNVILIMKGDDNEKSSN